MLSKHIAPNIKSDTSEHPIAHKLRSIMHKKQTNLAVAADVRTKQELLDLVDAVGHEMCILKTHIDIIDDFDDDLIMQLLCKAKDYNFLICEDRKFADIGSTALAQCTGGIYRIADWADIVIAHAISGPGIIEALRTRSRNFAVLLIAELSSKGNLITASYTQQVVQLAQEYNDVVIGIIAQQAHPLLPWQFKCTPGVNMHAAGDALGQQYHTPEYVIEQLGTDIIIVGRDIYCAKDQKKAAQAYKDAAWTAYKN